MKKALKVISLMLVAVLMVMSFAACGSKDDTATGSDTSKEAKTPAVKVTLRMKNMRSALTRISPSFSKRSTALLPKSKLTELSTQYAINISPAALPM